MNVDWASVATMFGMLIMWLRVEHRLTKLETKFRIYNQEKDEDNEPWD